MKYRVVNLGSGLGGMLEDYQNEIDNLRARLNPGGYIQPGPVPLVPNPPSSTQPPRPTPRPNPIRPGAGTPPTSVATGYPTEPPPPLPPLPPPPGPPAPGEPRGGCPPGTTWTPSGCLPNVPSTDWSQRDRPTQPPPAGPPTPKPKPLGPGGEPPPTSIATGYPTSPGPTPMPPPPPVPPPIQGCPPGYTMTPAGCRPDVPTTDRVYPRSGGFPGGFPGGMPTGGGVTAGAGLFGLGAPHFSRPIRLRGR